MTRQGKKASARQALPPLREADVLIAVRDYLAARGFAVFRRNVGAMRTETTFVRFASPGMADLYGWHRGTGRHLECEVKRPGQEPTAAQYAWLEYCKRDGAIAIWADSPERAAMALAVYGI